MGWGRIDDGFDDHAKVIALLEHEDGAAAIGLWTLCFTWAHRNTRKKGKTPGLIPSSLPRRYVGPKGRELAGLLVKVGLWEDHADDGWMFHDFHRYLPTDQTRDARSEAGKRGAQARWGNRAGRDGKLPSNGSNGMAPDSNVDGLSGGQDGADSGNAQRLPPGSNEPYLDGKLPSVLPSVDSKTMASNGSRAPARRAISNEIAPTPVPVPEPKTLSVADVDNQSSGRNARATEDPVIQKVQQVIYDVTSRAIDALWAGWIRDRIAKLATDDELGPAYFEKAIRSEPDPVGRFLENQPPPPWCGQCNTYRRLEHPETQADLGRCPDCHPEARAA